MKNIFKNLIIFIATFSASLPLNAQVTIGINDTPLGGTLLDLREEIKSDESANSKKGLLLPRVILTDESELFPMLKGDEANYLTLKKTHTGLLVYNTQISSYFTIGLYLWNGEKWTYLENSTSPLSTKNGISLDNNIIELGGDLTIPTTINLLDNNLNFSTTSGAVGFNKATPNAFVQISPVTNYEPLIIDSVRYITDTPNVIDGTNTTYYDLQISESGVVRKVPPTTTDVNQASVYDLSTATGAGSLTPASGDASGLGGSVLQWQNPSGGSTIFSTISLPEKGAYVFSFRFYGSTSGSPNGTGAATTFYITAEKSTDNGTSFTPFDIVEAVVVKGDKTVATYSVNLSVSGNSQDLVRFRMATLTTSASFAWNLRADPNSNKANRTSMVYWKI